MTTLTRDILAAARMARDQANEDYWTMVARAQEQGWTNTEIAHVLGINEAAIRMHFKRHPRHLTTRVPNDLLSAV